MVSLYAPTECHVLVITAWYTPNDRNWYELNDRYHFFLILLYGTFRIWVNYATNSLAARELGCDLDRQAIEAWKKKHGLLLNPWQQVVGIIAALAPLLASGPFASIIGMSQHVIAK